MSTINRVFKLRDKSTGLFYTVGGFTSKKGKAWQTLGHVKQHIACKSRFYRKKLMKSAEIVEFELVENQSNDVADFF